MQSLKRKCCFNVSYNKSKKYLKSLKGYRKCTSINDPEMDVCPKANAEMLEVHSDDSMDWCEFAMENSLKPCSCSMEYEEICDLPRKSKVVECDNAMNCESCASATVFEEMEADKDYSIEDTLAERLRGVSLDEETDSEME